MHLYVLPSVGQPTPRAKTSNLDAKSVKPSKYKKPLTWKNVLFYVASVVLCGLVGKITRVTLNGTFCDIQLEVDGFMSRGCS